MQKYFISKEELENKIIVSDDVNHIKNVMRSKIGDQIIVSDQTKTFLVKISSIAKEVTFEIIEELYGNNELPFFVTLFQGYPKGDKLDDIIKHGTEFGVSEFYPTIMKRSVFKLDEKRKQNKLERFNKIAKEASEQSFRNIVPKVVDILNLNKIDFSKYDIKILCNEESSKNGDLTNFKNTVQKIKTNDTVAILIGPEGGLDPKEIEYLESIGFISCSLGKRILRTESAIYYCMASLSYEFELKN